MNCCRSDSRFKPSHPQKPIYASSVARAKELYGMSKDHMTGSPAKKSVGFCMSSRKATIDVVCRTCVRTLTTSDGQIATAVRTPTRLPDANVCASVNSSRPRKRVRFKSEDPKKRITFSVAHEDNAPEAPVQKARMPSFRNTSSATASADFVDPEVCIRAFMKSKGVPMRVWAKAPSRPAMRLINAG